jgi:hypothetical protein
MSDALSISTILARECEKAAVVDIQRSEIQLMKTKFFENSAAENEILGCFNSSIQLSLCRTEADDAICMTFFAPSAIAIVRSNSRASATHNSDKGKQQTITDLTVREIS